MMIRKKRHVDCRNASRVDSELNTALEINERICTSVMGKEDDEGRDEDGGCKFSSRRKSFVRQEEDQEEVAPKKFSGPCICSAAARKRFLQAGTLSARWVVGKGAIRQIKTWRSGATAA